MSTLNDVLGQATVPVTLPPGTLNVGTADNPLYISPVRSGLQTPVIPENIGTIKTDPVSQVLSPANAPEATASTPITPPVTTNTGSTASSPTTTTNTTPTAQAWYQKWQVWVAVTIIAFGGYFLLKKFK